MGRHDLVDDPAFTDVANRLANFDALRRHHPRLRRPGARPRHIRVDLRRAPTRRRTGAPTRRADRDGVGGRARSRGRHRRSHGGSIRVPNVPWHFSDAPDVAVSGIAKYRGEDNRTVLHDILGYDDAKLDDLESSGVLSSRIPRPARGRDKKFPVAPDEGDDDLVAARETGGRSRSSGTAIAPSSTSRPGPCACRARPDTT